MKVYLLAKCHVEYHRVTSLNICGLRWPTRHYQLCFELFRTRRLLEITEDSHKYTRDESLGEDIHRRGAYAAFCAGNTRQSARSQCEGVGNRRQGRDPVFYLNDVKGEPPRLESGRVAALSIHQPLSISIVSLFIPSPPALRTRASCARPLHFPSRSIGWYERRATLQTRVPVRIGPSASIIPHSTRASSVA